jgi:hypothetical protein
MVRRARHVQLPALLLAAWALAAGCRNAEPPVPAPAGPPQAASTTEAAKPAEPALRVTPGAATLAGDDPGLQLVAESLDPSGPIDVTHEAAWTAEPAGIVAVEPGGFVRPLAAGHVRIQVQARGRQGVAEISVADRAGRSWDFAADVVPLFTRFGCNTGGCHGRADGQNGFHLSLFGYDPEGDHAELLREAGGRRVDRVSPDASLLLRKATGQVAHEGGQRFAVTSDAYRTLRAWIADGAPIRRGATHGALVRVVVEPAAEVLHGPGERQLRVIAAYADGHTRDVTRLALYRSNDPSTVAVDEHGRARLARRGETDLIVRYQSRVVAARLAAPVNPDLAFDFGAQPRRNLIDEQIFKRLEALKVPPSPPASDAAFLRRASLDLTGQLPQPDEIRAFLADTAPEKRARKIDELMARKEFESFWLIKLGDLLQITRNRFGNGSGPYQNWLKQRWGRNVPWDAMVRELLTALGDPTNFQEGGPVNYAVEGGDPLVQAELTARRFLGLRLRCAQCHDHPFDAWTQDDYYGLAAFFAKIDRGGGELPPGAMGMRQLVRINPKGVVLHKRTNQPAAPRLLGGDAVEVREDADPRRALADWITRPDNPYFARAAANWAWAQLFGRGLAEPADDLGAANPPVHPELLDALARHFVESKYDLRALIRTIATSEVYGLASEPVPGNEHDARLFSHHLPRPLSAYQIADALAYATQVPNLFPEPVTNRNMPRKAIEIFDPATPSVILDTFGRCPRDEVCATTGAPALGLRQALLLIGGDAIDGKVGHIDGYLAHLLALDPAPDEIVEFLYMRTLCRPPTDEERSHWAAELRGAASLREAAEDLFWALLNSREFAFNH